MALQMTYYQTTSLQDTWGYRLKRSSSRSWILQPFSRQTSSQKYTSRSLTRMACPPIKRSIQPSSPQWPSLSYSDWCSVILVTARVFLFSRRCWFLLDTKYPHFKDYTKQGTYFYWWGCLRCSLGWFTMISYQYHWICLRVAITLRRGPDWTLIVSTQSVWTLFGTCHSKTFNSWTQSKWKLQSFSGFYICRLVSWWRVSMPLIIKIDLNFSMSFYRSWLCCWPCLAIWTWWS